MSNYWKPTTPEQIADFKARRKIINKASKERIKLRQQGLLEAGKMGRGDALTAEQREIRNEQQRSRRGKVKDEKLDKPKPVRATKPRIYSRANPRQAPKQMATLAPDPLKIRRELKPGFSIFTYPDADLDEKRAKYGIAI